MLTITNPPALFPFTKLPPIVKEMSYSGDVSIWAEQVFTLRKIWTNDTLCTCSAIRMGGSHWKFLSRVWDPWFPSVSNLLQESHRLDGQKGSRQTPCLNTGQCELHFNVHCLLEKQPICVICFVFVVDIWEDGHTSGSQSTWKTTARRARQIAPSCHPRWESME